MSKLIFTIVAGALFTAHVTSAAAEDFQTWLGNQAQYSVLRLQLAISPPGAARGAIMASPSTENPNYYYHWVRDAAIAARETVELYRRAATANEKQFWEQQIFDYASFSRQNQKTANWSGSPDTTGLGEPKFLMSGAAYNLGWGRPQTDGPALRTLALCEFAWLLIQQGRIDQVRAQLYNPQMPADSVIKVDLEYIARQWQAPSFDIWEETFGYHFYNRLVQYASLIEGARLAKVLGDSGAASFYTTQALQIKPTLDSFWDAGRGYFVATQGSNQAPFTKPSNLDTAVLLGFLHSGALPLSDRRVMSTVSHLERGFQFYAINNNSNLPPAIGRYPEDTYDGYRSASLGNPWFLTTHAMAQYYYSLANEIERTSRLNVTQIQKTFLKTVHNDAINLDDLVAALRMRGDLYLQRSKFHTGPDHAQSEEINRQSGYQQGAAHLTWSYTSFLSAVRARGPVLLHLRYKSGN